MARIYFARGSRGGVIRKFQVALATSGHYTGILDGSFGGGTEKAVRALQADHQLIQTGLVDEPVWSLATSSPIPPVAERCIQLSAAFEGHGFSILEGNFDGAWLTWGIIGFTLKHGELQKIIMQVWQQDPATLRAAFGERTAQLVGLMSRNDPSELSRWADEISLGASKSTVAETWRSAFGKLGENSLVQQIQIERAMADYYDPSRITAAHYNLTTELGIALCFDIHVQNGGVKQEARKAIEKAIGSDFTKQTELTRRVALANAVADAASSTYREDVRARKLATATGSGKVHGEAFQIDHWGLGEFPG